MDVISVNLLRDFLNYRQYSDLLFIFLKRIFVASASDDNVNFSVLTHFFFPSDLYEERAILLGKLGQHEKALAIYVIVLGDIEKASRYCKQIYETGGPSGKLVVIYYIFVCFSQMLSFAPLLVFILQYKSLNGSCKT